MELKEIEGLVERLRERAKNCNGATGVKPGFFIELENEATEAASELTRLAGDLREAQDERPRLLNQIEVEAERCGDALNDKEAAESRATALAGEVERLRAALRPFAALAEQIDAWRHEDVSTCTHRLKAKDIRAARAALTEDTTNA